MTDTTDRRDTDPLLHEHGRNIRELWSVSQRHGETLIKHSAQFEHMAPKLEMLEVKGKLEDRMGRLESGLQTVANELKEMGHQIAQSMSRMADQNEENMQEKSRLEQEAHRKALEVRDAEIAALKAKSESNRLDAIVTRWGGSIMTAITVGAAVWAIWQYLVRAALAP